MQIRLKELLYESVSSTELTSKDIFNFYYLWILHQNFPHLFKNKYGKYILEDYSSRLKTKYITVFKKLMVDQLFKYARRGRTDANFNVDLIKIDAPTNQLWELMQKTFRSDMRRRNDKWNLVGEFTTKLEKTPSLEYIFLYIDRLNAVVHNTHTKVLEKFNPNLLKALDIVANNDIMYWRKYVSREIRELENNI